MMSVFITKADGGFHIEEIGEHNREWVRTTVYQTAELIKEILAGVK